MDMTSKIATTALLVALVATGCGGGGPSEAEIETACWAKRTAIFDEIEAVEEMMHAQLRSYEDRVLRIEPEEGASSSSYSQSWGLFRARIQDYLFDQLSDC